MAMYFKCPHCRVRLKAFERLAGRKAVCTKCKKRFIIPGNRTARAPVKGAQSQDKRAIGEPGSEDEFAEIESEIEEAIQKREAEIDKVKTEQRFKSREVREVISQEVFVGLVKEVDQEIAEHVNSKEDEMREAEKNDSTILGDAVFIGAEPATVQKLITSAMRSNPTALVGSSGTARIKRRRTVAQAKRMSRRSKIPKDDDLIELIEEAFHRDERVCLEPINVSVTNGMVTLNGAARTYRRKLAAQEIASSFEGCRDVVNKLTVDPETPPPDREVAKNVKCSLNASADVTADVVNAAVTNGSVSLSGAVRSAWERLVAEDVARSAQGVRDVENLLVVDPWPRSTMGK